MKVIMILGIHFLTAFIIVLSGLLCWKRHSTFPNTKIGYNVRFAVLNAKIWKSANLYLGKMLVILGVLSFGVLPLVIYVWLHYSFVSINTQFLMLLVIYFIELAALVVCVLFLPQRKFKNE
jgi:uncharacterized membrane protein